MKKRVSEIWTSLPIVEAKQPEIWRKKGGGGKTLCGFGDFSNQHGLVKRRPTAPIKQLKGELHKYYKVVEIYEYGTSQTCSLCNNRVELYRNYIRRKKDGRSRTHSKNV